VEEKLCTRRPGIGFVYEGRRLMGITEYLRRNYFPVFTASRRGNGGSKKKRGLGMRMGSWADSAITNFAKTGNTRKMAACPNAIRLVNFLRTLGLTIVDAHVLVCEPVFGIATEIDVLCDGPHGLVVIENKTTLQTRAEHERTYKKPDRECPLLLQGFLSLLNNEYNHHQLQLAAMIIMMKNTYNINAHGHVLVASADGLNHYPMNPAILNLARNVLGTRRFFSPPLANTNLPLIRYKYRPLLSRFIEGPGFLSVPPLIEKFLKKHYPLQLTANHLVGSVSFYERPDVTIPLGIDFVAETPEKMFFFMVRSDSANLDQYFIELAAAVVVHKALQKKPIEARILLLSPKPMLKKLPAKVSNSLKS